MMILKQRLIRRLLAVAMAWACAAGLSGQLLEAAATNVIWQATLTGTLGIQGFAANAQPRLESTKLKTADFLRIVTGGVISGGEVLAVNIDLQGTDANFILTVFDKTSRQNIQRLSINETTTLISDGKNLVFSWDAPLVTGLGDLRGGRFKITGKGKISSGVPAALKANVEGILIDARPGDLGGTTGVVLRATLTTVGAPLRVQPAAGP
jgi:hypothetical protein